MRGRDDRVAQHYQAIIESSDDAILSKDLDGVILSWNNGAERLFGFTAEEAIGKPVTIVIPLDRRDEEPAILDKIHRGERIHHFETVRQRKDGSLLDISLTISPIRDSRGKIVGASKIARDITELKKARERQQLLLREMSHRVKNLFALSGSIVSLSARSATSVDKLAASTRERLSALARAHSLTFLHGADSAATPYPTTLQSLVRTIVAPFDEPDQPRILLSGIDAGVCAACRHEPCPPLARIRDQRGQIWRPLHSVRNSESRPCRRRRRDHRPLDRTWRTSGLAADGG